MNHLIFVCGTASSGSSCVAGILHHLGVDMGDFHDGPGLRGYTLFEDNLRIRDYCTKGLNDGYLFDREYDIRGYIEARLSECAPGERAGFKHTPLCWLSDPDPGSLPLDVVLMSRPLETSIASDQKIWGKIAGEDPRFADKNTNRGRARQAATVAAAWKAAQLLAEYRPPRIVVPFHQVLVAPHQWVYAITEALNLTPTSQQMDAAVGSVWT